MTPVTRPSISIQQVVVGTPNTILVKDTWLTLPRVGTSKSEESEGCVQGPAQIYKKIVGICVRISSSRLVCSKCRAGLDPPPSTPPPNMLLHTLPWLRPIRAQHMHYQQPTVGMVGSN